MEEIYNKYYFSLFSFAYKITGDKTEAEDIVVDCFVKVHTGDYFGILNLKAFLFASVKNACLNFLKKRKRDQLKQKEYALIKETSESPTWQEVEENILKTIHDHINELPGQQKEITLMYLSGKSTEEISKKLGIEPVSVRSIKRTAINKIKASFHRIRFNGFKTL